MIAITTAVWLNDDVDPEEVEGRAEQPEAAERDDQPDARDRGRQHDRQLDERDRERPALEPVRGEEPGRRRPEGEDDDLRDDDRLQADDQRVGDDRVRDLVQQVGPGGTWKKIATTGSTMNANVIAIARK